MPNLPLLKIWRKMRMAGQIYVSHGKRLNLRRYLDFYPQKGSEKYAKRCKFCFKFVGKAS